MSCFSGNFLSLPGVRCDRFDSLYGGGSTAAADQFFLSHCHTDHMIGLDALGSFIKKRKKSSGASGFKSKLYCSMISSTFVQRMYPDIPNDAIIELLPNHPQTVAVSDRDSCEVYSLRVTALHANHCPGSLMFMLEKLDSEGVVSKRILYTGDFRFDNTQLSLTCLQALHSGSSPLTIDEMYLDTTFCSTKYLNFPPRKLAEEKIWDICQKWVKKNGMFKDSHTKHVVLFQLPARYGYENILQHIYQRSSIEWRVHVPQTKFSDYLCDSSLADCTDPDPNIAQWIHACTTDFKKKSLLNKLPCQSSGVSVCHIKPSAMFFNQSKMTSLQASGQDSMVSINQGGNSYRVCYSTHSSMEELETFVRHFSPLQITPCAIPPTSSKEEVRNILASFLQPSQSPTATDTVLLPHTSLSPHKPMPSSVPADHARYDPDVWVSPSPPEQNKRKIENGEGQAQEIQAKVVRLEKEDSLSKICFNDTMDLEENEILEEATSSDEDEELNIHKEASCLSTKKDSANESFSLVLEPSDDEDLFDSVPSRDDSILVIESNLAHVVSENDTPEIEDLLAEAEENDMPEYVIKTMREFKKRKDEVIVIE